MAAHLGVTSANLTEPKFSETFTSLAKAQDFADKRLGDRGHRCEQQSCTDWLQSYIVKWFAPSGTVESCEYLAPTPWEAGTLGALHFQRLREDTLVPRISS